ncbi:hypothetical protein MUO65_03155, partial [bacterium]|nr:hypothetical protein [bacterium]
MRKLLFLFLTPIIINFSVVGEVRAAVCFCQCERVNNIDTCWWADCPLNVCGCECEWHEGICSEGSCQNCTGCSGGGCFTGETGISVGESENSENSENSETKKISELKPGDIVESFSPETGEIKEGTVSDVTKTTREGYYILETESGKKVKVTGEHPFLAIKSEKNQESINQISNFKN